MAPAGRWARHARAVVIATGLAFTVSPYSVFLTPAASASRAAASASRPAVEIQSMTCCVVDGQALSISYQLAPRCRWPDQMEDVSCAMRSLRAHAAARGTDPNRIAVLGSSAGAQLASPLDHVTPGDLPTLILQGTADNVVPLAESGAFVARLAAARVQVHLILARGGQHGLHTPGEVPSRASLDATVAQFLTSQLG